MIDDVFWRLVGHNHQQRSEGFSVSDNHLGRGIDHELYRYLSRIRIGLFTGWINDSCTMAACVVKGGHHAVVGPLVNHRCVVIAVDRRDCVFKPLTAMRYELISLRLMH